MYGPSGVFEYTAMRLSVRVRVGWGYSGGHVDHRRRIRHIASMHRRNPCSFGAFAGYDATRVVSVPPG